MSAFGCHFQTVNEIKALKGEITRLTAERDAALIALDRLMLGLDSTHWSSWQNTSRFANQMEAARAVLATAPKPEGMA